MAAGVIPAVGSPNGPCADCQHEDCASIRRLAAQACQICGEPIGYQRGFYLANPAPDVVHAVCEEKRIEAHRELMLREEA